MDSLDVLKTEIKSSLYALGLAGWEQLTLGHGVAEQYAIKNFGVVVCVVDKENISFVASKLYDFFSGWRVIYVTSIEELSIKKDELLWELARSGYFRWLRLTNYRKFSSVLSTSNLANKIIKKRLSIYGNKQKYNFFRQEDESALKTSTVQLLSMDPSFFDFIPEEEISV